MGTRTLISGATVAETPASVKMTIDSKCPQKWLFVDLETGDIWERREDGHFRQAKPDKVSALAEVVKLREKKKKKK